MEFSRLPFAGLLLVWILVVALGMLLVCYFAAVSLCALLAGPPPIRIDHQLKS
jgi:hypothetical protein